MTMEKTKTTPRDFFLWAGATIAFYWSVIAFILLAFEYLNYLFPNLLSYYPASPYDTGIPYEMASVIVLLPLYLWLMHVIRKDAARDPSRKEVWVRRWAILLTLFLSGVAIAADLITILTSFLSGEALTTVFLLKAAVVLVVAIVVFAYFSADLKGYWEMYPSRKRYASIAVALIAIATIAGGFYVVGTPQQARLERFDVQKVNDLQVLQPQIVYYWQAKRVLPAKLGDIVASGVNSSIPLYDGQSGQQYGYQITGPRSFKLCATFNAANRTSVGLQTETREVQPIKGTGTTDNWDHKEGDVCFERTIDPAFYPPLQAGG